jgi:hypothetical protein
MDYLESAKLVIKEEVPRRQRPAPIGNGLNYNPNPFYRLNPQRALCNARRTRGATEKST